MNFKDQLRIPKKEFQIWKELVTHGFQAYLVGGAVRDLILGNDPKDWDFATNATPDQIKEIFKGHKVDLVGATFGVVIVDGIEVATFRGDRYHGGGDKDVTITYVDTIEEDLKRRDFTFNAMALTMAGDLIDPHDGYGDLAKGAITVRFVGDPKERIKEDPNRMLRAFRFAAVLKGSLDIDTYIDIMNSVSLIHTIAPERIRLEILKTLSAADVPSYFWSLAYHTGVLEIIFPDLAATYGHDHGIYHNEDIWTHSMVAGNKVSKKFPLIRLGAFLHDVGKVKTYDPENGSFHDHQKVSADIVRDWMSTMKFTNDEIRYVVNLALAHMDGTRFMTPKARRRLKNKLGRYGLDWRDWLRVRIADRAGNLKRPDFTISDIRQYVNHFVIEEEVPFGVNSLALKGGDIINIFRLKPGPLVGEIQRELLELVLENGTHLNTPEHLTGATREILTSRALI